MELELDRHLARRFNVFKYLRTDELGLSRIIADLLDPAAEHGQGTLFLRATLDAIPETRTLSGTIQESATDPIKVVTERQITGGRRIDISVDIPTSGEPFCLAFENKPYAEDQPDQIIDYLNFLQGEYGSRFLLVYVPPYEREPDESAFPLEARQRWRGNFRVMPYSGSDISLEAWIENCRKRCETERLNWFFRQAQTFCRQQFGGSNLTTDAESREIRAYLSENPGHLQAALVIHDAWPLVRTQICESFLEHLRDQVENQLNIDLNQSADGLHVICRFEGDKRYSTELSIRKDDWVPYSIKLQSGSRGTIWWQWGISCAIPLAGMSDQEKKLRAAVKSALTRHGLTVGEDDEHHWPQRQWVPRFENWHQLAPELDSEVKGTGSDITNFYVDGLLRMAEFAVPAIDEVTKSSRTDLAD